ncbi:hypothetical protein FOZ60_015806 [Perkinsus olseni]|uniref:Uncharacterized protein n=1 Tax=Perkinsus olseni TaxID=32597 RepID=A0A7J6N585_PEROL|nr:hypothetical protein FOZ60_015806 [Perkinsus olseni]
MPHDKRSVACSFRDHLHRPSSTRIASVASIEATGKFFVFYGYFAHFARHWCTLAHMHIFKPGDKLETLDGRPLRYLETVFNLRRYLPPVDNVDSYRYEEAEAPIPEAPAAEDPPEDDDLVYLHF